VVEAFDSIHSIYDSMIHSISIAIQALAWPILLLLIRAASRRWCNGVKRAAQSKHRRQNSYMY
jgi:hypothetical protein